MNPMQLLITEKELFKLYCDFFILQEKKFQAMPFQRNSDEVSLYLLSLY